MHMAKILTFPERVTKLNKDRLKTYVLNGSDKYPGANYFISKDGLSKNNLMFGNRRRIADEIKIGDVVERHLIDNDIVLFNRQPSLHRLSIMCHRYNYFCYIQINFSFFKRAKIMPWNTLRFNECVCTPYNADFDGDEMNIHVPQTLEAKAEAYYLMRVQENLITPKNGEPIVALTQDFLTSAFLITKRDVFYDRANFTQICSYFNDANEQIDLPVPAILKPIGIFYLIYLFFCFLLFRTLDWKTNHQRFIKTKSFSPSSRQHFIEREKLHRQRRVYVPERWMVSVLIFIDE